MIKRNYKRNKAAAVLNRKPDDGKPIERLAKPQTTASPYSTRTDRAEGTIVASRKEKEWSFNGIDI